MQTNLFRSTRLIVLTAVMAALCFAATYIHIAFSLGGASSSTMVHLGSAACFLSAMLLGPLSGGLASGIGMSAYDLLNGYALTAPWTLVIKFLTGFVVGKIAWSRGFKGNSQKINLIACVAGGLVSLIGYAVCDFVNALLVGNTVPIALVTVASGLVGSLLTTLIAVVIAIPLNDSVSKALGKSKLLPN